MGETVRLRTAGAQPASYRSGLVAALDVGSSKTVCLIGRAEPAQLRVLGVGLREPLAQRMVAQRLEKA